MRTIVMLATSAALALSFSVGSADAAKRTIRVIDGDTIKASSFRAPIRLKGFDAPAINKSSRSGYKCDAELQKGLEAKAALQALLDPPHKVTIARTKDKDEYGRRVAVVRSDGKDVGPILISQGLAQEWNGSGPKPSWCDTPTPTPAPQGR